MVSSGLPSFLPVFQYHSFKKKLKPPPMRNLLRTLQSYNQGLLPTTLDLQVIWLPRSSQAFYLAGLNKHISSNEDSERWQLENSLLNALRSFLVSGYVFFSLQYLCQLLKLCQQNPSRKTWCFLIVYLNNILISMQDAGQGYV